tara:strand:- start:991 stop:1149 length:159 start_codon:yes stop_codon:yes gene_type:complete
MINFIKNLLGASNNNNDVLNNQNYDDEIYWSEIEEQWADFEILDKDLDDLTW